MKPHLLFVLGPTASGKSDLAIDIARDFNAKQKQFNAIEILNCDSVAFFDGVEIGAAKPSFEQRNIIPHHLVGHVTKGAEYTAGAFRRDAVEVIEAGAKRNVQHFVAVGGSGFYVQALEKGMYETPPVDPSIRIGVEADMAKLGSALVHEELTRRDPEAAARINANDRYRVARAVEILRANADGKTLSELRAEFEALRTPPPFIVNKIGLLVSRDRLRERITLRTRRMLENGLIEETEQLRTEGLRDWPTLKSVGYKETQMFLDGELPRENLEASIITSTMQLAKRQMTWFKRDTSIKWFDLERERSLSREFAFEVLASLTQS